MADRPGRTEVDAMTTTTLTKPRVWLVAGLSTIDTNSDVGDGADAGPVDRPVVRDDLMRTWEPGEGNEWHTSDGRHHATWRELRNRYDLVEVRS